jgi:hypothetical protein
MTTLAKKSTEWKGDKNNDDMICKLPQPQPSSIGNPKYNFADIPGKLVPVLASDLP